MQMIEAVIKPQRLDNVKAALAAIEITGATAIECKGFGRQLGHTERYRGGRMDIGFVPKILLKVCVPAEKTNAAVKAIIQAARTGTNSSPTAGGTRARSARTSEGDLTLKNCMPIRAGGHSAPLIEVLAAALSRICSDFAS